MHCSTTCCSVVVYSTLPWMCDWEPTKSIQGENIKDLYSAVDVRLIYYFSI